MAAPYLLAMEHAEWSAGKILRKHQLNRPLGRIENEYHYTPRQPVLSCRSLHVDLSGTRTYRPCSNTDILEEQHKLIHNVYLQARNVASAPPGQRTAPVPPPSPMNKHPVHKSMKVQGSHSPPNYPETQTQPSATLSLRKRPKTAGVVSAATDPHTLTSANGEVDASAKNLRQVNALVHNHWDKENHGLEGGDFSRNSPQVRSRLEPKKAGQWLVFGGGERRVKSAGVVDAFTGMRQREEYYTIDGNTGCQVAKQLRHGDRIQVGINGKPRGFAPWKRSPQPEPGNNANENIPGGKSVSSIIPLCWEDQILMASGKVLEPSGHKDKQKKQSLCETSPVVFRAQSAVEADQRTYNQRSKSQHGYHLKASTRPRRTLSGSHTNSRITNYSFRPDDYDSGEEDITLDEILRTQLSPVKVHHSEKAEEAALPPEPAHHDAPTSYLSPPDDRGDSSSTSSDKIYKHYEKEIMITPEGDLVRNPYGVVGSRPLTAYSGTTQEADLESLVVTAGGKASQPLAKTPEGRPNRVPSGGRPPPAKPNLHKTSAAAGATIQGSVKGDPKFIQISQQMAISKDRPGTSSSRCSRPNSPPSIIVEGNTQVIDQVRDHNMMVMVSDEMQAIKEVSPRVPEPPSNTPPCSRDATPDFPPVHYAFDIPTGQILDADVLSAAEPGDQVDH